MSQPGRFVETDLCFEPRLGTTSGSLWSRVLALLKNKHILLVKAQAS